MMTDFNPFSIEVTIWFNLQAMYHKVERDVEVRDSRALATMRSDEVYFLGGGSGGNTRYAIRTNLNGDSSIFRFCECKNINQQTQECYDQMVSLKIPDHMEIYRKSKIKNNGTDRVCIDPCIVSEIEWLWSKGIATYGCCCGHNKQESFVNVDDSNIQQMLGMGYVQNHTDKERKDTFRLKSAG